MTRQPKTAEMLYELADDPVGSGSLPRAEAVREDSAIPARASRGPLGGCPGASHTSGPALGVSMRKIRALPTTYAGVKFRSRLEARWALFFDKLGIRWEYEPEGFALPSGECYLPDFRLAGIGYFEVKPDDAPSDDRWFEFAKALGDNLFIVRGKPNRIRDYAADEIEVCMAGGGWDSDYAWCVCPWCGKAGLQFNGRGARICGWSAHHKTTSDAMTAIEHMGHWRVDDKCYTYDDPRIVTAMDAALSARFGT